MSTILQKTELFLDGDLSIGLANVRAYLEWSSSSGAHAVVLSPDNAASIVASLFQLERRASLLAEALRGQRRRPIGLTDTLHRLNVECAA